MSVEIKYNGASLSYGYGSGQSQSQPVPFFSEAKEMIEISHARWGQRCNLTLDGQLTGRGNLFVDTYTGVGGGTPAVLAETLTGHVEELVSKFNNNYKDLSIFEDGVEILNYPNCQVDSITFAESNMGSIIDYTVNLSSYANFSGTFGVINPSENISYNERENGLIDASYEVSAQGFTTDQKTAFYNAKDFVKSRLSSTNHLNQGGGFSRPVPKFMGLTSSVRPILLNRTENIDRLNGTYGVQENYLIDPNQSSTGSAIVEDYSVSWETGIEADEVSVTVDGTFIGGKDIAFSDLRLQADNTAIGSHRLYKTATGESKISELIEQPVSKNVTEDTYNNSVTISATFTNNPLLVNLPLNGVSKYASVWYEPSISFETDHTKDKVSVSISGPLTTNVSLRKEKWEAIYDYLINTLYTRSDGVAGFLKNIANEVYTPMFGSTYPLHSEPLSLTVAMNENAGTIDLSATFDNRDSLNSFVSDASYTVNVKPSIPIYKPHASYNENGYYIIYDINSKNREKISFQTDVKYATSGDNDGLSDGLHNITSKPTTAGNWSQVGFGVANTMLSNLGSAWLVGNDTVLESESSSRNDQGRFYSVSQSYNQDEVNQTLSKDQTYIPINVFTIS